MLESTSLCYSNHAVYIRSELSEEHVEHTENDAMSHTGLSAATDY